MKGDQNCPQFRALLLGKSRANRIPREYFAGYFLLRLILGSLIITITPDNWGFWPGFFAGISLFISLDVAIRYSLSISKLFWSVWDCLPRPYLLKRLRILARWGKLPSRIGPEGMATLESIATRVDQIRSVTTDAMWTGLKGGPARVAQIEMWLSAEKLVGQALDLILRAKGRPENLDIAALQSIENRVQIIETDSLLNLGRNVWQTAPISSDARSV